MKRKAERRIRNPFYERVQRDGIRIVTPTPSWPHGERKPSNPYYERVRQAGGITLRVGGGRPPKGQETGPTVIRSVRLPPQIWRRLDAQAKREGITRHAAIRQAILIWLRS